MRMAANRARLRPTWSSVPRGWGDSSFRSFPLGGVGGGYLLLRRRAPGGYQREGDVQDDAHAGEAEDNPTDADEDGVYLEILRHSAGNASEHLVGGAAPEPSPLHQPLLTALAGAFEDGHLGVSGEGGGGDAELCARRCGGAAHGGQEVVDGLQVGGETFG